MTSISGVSQSNAANPIAGATGKAGVMDKDGFLNLFLASLQYQDPSSPMETADMMAQLSQLANMESVQNMTDAVSELKKMVNEMNGGLDKGASYLGKEVTGINSEGNTVKGIVESVYTDSESVYLVIGEDKLLIPQVAMLTEPSVGIVK